MDWLDAVTRARREGSPVVLVTVAAVRGHAPRDAGAKMVVGADHSWGSVGGGNLEEAAITRAREIIATGVITPETQVSKLSDKARNRHGRQCCGGEVTLLLEPLPARPTVAIFGLGHVGLELGRILSRLDLRLVLVDSREDQLEPLRLAEITGGPADVSVQHLLLGEQQLEALPRGAHVLVMSHDHAEDFALCDTALRLPQLGSIGLIGSSAKWTGFRRRLTEAGHDAATIDRIRCPIGLPGIGGKEPAVIAISVAAEMLGLIGASGSSDKGAASMAETPLLDAGLTGGPG
ncbi:xanthine dehydrogenase accessory protein XdhC [Nakamurella flava]|uniref:Xanthine dehydrogenase accessory protein XdhC n=1 Tax=Nakamurella flava TaxID=2576308 RepID=A0A4U6QFJ9_9ACTN|nr:xanthine dehydrogenase accessory protein XdhC [Nakamurella flava]TKV58858.1 xanthine dehydrogenase accessory protein XdhC [Nakamurella flava]